MWHRFEEVAVGGNPRGDIDPILMPGDRRG